MVICDYCFIATHDRLLTFTENKSPHRGKSGVILITVPRHICCSSFTICWPFCHFFLSFSFLLYTALLHSLQDFAAISAVLSLSGERMFQFIIIVRSISATAASKASLSAILVSQMNRDRISASNQRSSFGLA